MKKLFILIIVLIFANINNPLNSQDKKERLSIGFNVGYQYAKMLDLNRYIDLLNTKNNGELQNINGLNCISTYLKLKPFIEADYFLMCQLDFLKTSRSSEMLYESIDYNQIYKTILYPQTYILSLSHIYNFKEFNNIFFNGGLGISYYNSKLNIESITEEINQNSILSNSTWSSNQFGFQTFIALNYRLNNRIVFAFKTRYNYINVKNLKDENNHEVLIYKNSMLIERIGLDFSGLNFNIGMSIGLF